MKKNFYAPVIATLLAVSLGILADLTDQRKNITTNSYDVKYEELDNRHTGWGLKRVKHSEPEIPESQKDMLKKYNAFYMDSKKEKKIYLTFDEGYENGFTSVILDILKEKNVPAAFFITGPYAKKETELVKRMIAEGHIVGNHTVNHPNLAKLSSYDKISDELLSLNKIVKELYCYDMTYMRPPEGEYSEKVLSIANDLGFRTVFWSFAYRDWEVKNQKGKDYAFNEVTTYLHPGAVLLLHAVSEDNKNALSDIIDYARNNGYTFSSLDEINTNQ